MRIIIIGAGPGGYETAAEAARRGIEVTLINGGTLGGVCLNEGCIPTKTLCHYAGLIEELSRAAGRDIVEGSLQWHFSKVAARKSEVVEQLRSGVAKMLGHKLITVVSGLAAFKDAHTVVVDGQEYSGDRVIIATGSVPAALPVPGAGLPGVVTSGEMLDLEGVPARLAVIGGGVIGLELASVFRSFGSEVTVLEYAPGILPRFDADLSKRLRLALTRRGVAIETSAEVKEVTSGADGLTVHYAKDGGLHSVTADKVLAATGRRPNLESLNISAIGVEYTRKGITVDSDMCTSVPGVYAVGDVTGGMMLAHVARFEGLRALNHICGVKDSIRLDIVPAAVFTIPEAASVGMTEEEAKAAGVQYKALKSSFRANGKAVSMDDADGYCKLLADAGDGRLLGAHMYGPHAADLIQEVAALMCLGGGASDLRDIIHAHPTLGEAVLSAASAF